MIVEYTPENIKKLKPNEIFVFGSNSIGAHSKGAALTAKLHFGAIYGQSEGLQIPTPDFTGRMTYSYGKHKRDDIKSKTTIDAVENGERTATTRFVQQGAIDYWANVKRGDIIKWKSLDKEVYVKVTNPLIKLDEKTSPEEWSKKEGWNIEYFEKNIRPRLEYAYQMEFEILPQSYAIITKKDWRIEKSSTLIEIKDSIKKMLVYAKENQNKKFYVTKLGSSLAGYTIEEIKNLFKELKNLIPDNVILPQEYEVRD